MSFSGACGAAIISFLENNRGLVGVAVSPPAREAWGTPSQKANPPKASNLKDVLNLRPSPVRSTHVSRAARVDFLKHVSEAAGAADGVARVLVRLHRKRSCSFSLPSWRIWRMRPRVFSR